MALLKNVFSPTFEYCAELDTSAWPLEFFIKFDRKARLLMEAIRWPKRGCQKNFFKYICRY